MSSWTDNSPVGNPAGRTAVGITTLVMAGSLLVFLHRDIGARLLLRLRILMAAALLIALANIEHPFDWRLAYFAGAFTLLAFFHHWRHMRRIRRGSPEWHSYDTGRSLIFSAAPFLPRSVAQVLLEPVLCAFGWHSAATPRSISAGGLCLRALRCSVWKTKSASRAVKDFSISGTPWSSPWISRAGLRTSPNGRSRRPARVAGINPGKPGSTDSCSRRAPLATRSERSERPRSENDGSATRQRLAEGSEKRMRNTPGAIQPPAA